MKKMALSLMIASNESICLTMVHLHYIVIEEENIFETVIDLGALLELYYFNELTTAGQLMAVIIPIVAFFITSYLVDAYKNKKKLSIQTTLNSL